MRVVAAMSGGVDSSVTAALLHEQGHEVIGVHMRLHDAEVAANATSKSCCGMDEALDARSVADRLGIAFHVLDLRQAFRKAVMDDLAKTYLAGRTPNPCIQCNGILKFKVLLERALALGADALATGHYARIDDGVLHRAVDVDKDQSYFLFPMTKKALEHTLFPLGGLTKAEVRDHARRFDLLTADKPESQEICFIPDQDHARFVREHTGHDGSGDIVDEKGRVLGQHKGYYRFTIGQRRGIGVAMGHKVYVKDIEPDTRRVIVAAPDSLWHSALDAAGWVWTRRPAPDQPVQARIRHNGGLLPATVDGDRVHFHQPAWAVAPGQAVVLYEGDAVLGGGWITQAHA